MMKNNYFFKKLTSKTQSKKKDVKLQAVIILLQETKNSERQKQNVKFNMKKVDLDES